MSFAIKSSDVAKDCRKLDYWQKDASETVRSYSFRASSAYNKNPIEP